MFRDGPRIHHLPLEIYGFEGGGRPLYRNAARQHLLRVKEAEDPAHGLALGKPRAVKVQELVALNVPKFHNSVRVRVPVVGKSLHQKRARVGRPHWAPNRIQTWVDLNCLVRCSVERHQGAGCRIPGQRSGVAGPSGGCQPLPPPSSHRARRQGLQKARTQVGAGRSGSDRFRGQAWAAERSPRGPRAARSSVPWTSLLQSPFSMFEN
jgi:hypothetical protein